jgi:Flp pilus assembly protein TadG
MSPLAARIRAWRTHERGAAAVEMALILPLVAVLLFALIEFGRLFWTYHIASAAVRDGARYGARLPVDCANLPTNPDWGSVRNMTRTGTPNGAAPLIPGWALNDITVTVSCATNDFVGPSGNVTFTGRYRGFGSVPKVRVSAKTPFSPLFGSLLPGMGITNFPVAHEQTWTG